MEALLTVTNADLGDNFQDSHQVRRPTEALTPSCISPTLDRPDSSYRRSGQSDFPLGEPLPPTLSTPVSILPAETLDGLPTSNAVMSVESLQSPPQDGQTISATGAREGDPIDEEEIIIAPQKVSKTINK